MAHTIEYKRQFIKSSTGITPLWLCGDSNTYESSRGNARRVRNWECFLNLFDVSEEEIIKRIQPLLNQGNEHWKRNGKWVDDDALCRWVRDGCKNAATVDELTVCPECSVYTCDTQNGASNELFEVIHSSFEFDKWVEQAKTIMDDVRKLDGGYARAQIILPEDLYIQRHFEPMDTVLVKCRNEARFEDEYISDISKYGNITLSSDIKDAWIFTFEDAVALLKGRSWGQKAKLIPSERMFISKDFVIQLLDSRGNIYYFAKKGRTAHYYKAMIYAKYFQTVNEAQKEVEKNASLFKKWNVKATVQNIQFL